MTKNYAVLICTYPVRIPSSLNPIMEVCVYQMCVCLCIEH